jgi:hypothetical protein
MGRIRSGARLDRAKPQRMMANGKRRIWSSE